MVLVEPIADAPAATVDLGDETGLLIADYHAGIEAALRQETGVEIESQAPQRQDRLLSLIDQHTPDRLVILGDLMHSIGDPGGAERGELEVLVEAIPDEIEITLTKGNHDGQIESWLPEVQVTDSDGFRVGDVGMVHGHTWPARSVLESQVVCIGHEHPSVKLTDTVGGNRVEPVWLRGPLTSTPFTQRFPDLQWQAPELIVCPAFNELAGGTWINTADEFLCPFLPEALPQGTAFLLDGTRLGPYRSI